MYSSQERTPIHDLAPQHPVETTPIIVQEKPVADCSVQVEEIIKKYELELSTQKQQIQTLLHQVQQQQTIQQQQQIQLQQIQVRQSQPFQVPQQVQPQQQMPPQQVQPQQQMPPQQVQPQQVPSKSQQQVQPQPVQQTPPQQPKFESFSTVVSEVTEETLAFVKNGPTIILFYAPWCVHCVHFKPIYEKIAATCLEKQIGVRFAALDGSKFPKVIQEYKLKAYPTIGVIRNNEFTMYSGQRSEPDIIEWIQTL